MNSVLRLVKGDAMAAPQTPVGEFLPGLPLMRALPREEPPATVEVAHLARCPQCGEMNGRSAESCWSCESELHPVLPLAAKITAAAAVAATLPPPATPRSPAIVSTVPVAQEASGVEGAPVVPETTADTVPEPHQTWHDLGLDLSAVAASALADEAASRSAGRPPGASADRSLPVLTMAIDLHAPYAGHAAPVPGARPRPVPLGVLAVIAAFVVVLVCGGAFVYLSQAESGAGTPGPADVAALRERRLATPQDPALQALPADPIAAADAALAKVDAALRAADLLARPMEPAAVGVAPPVVPVAAPSDRPARTVRRNTDSRETARGSTRPAAAPPAVLDRPERPIDPPPYASPSTPCTPAVLALGLCSPSPPSR